MSDQQTLSSTSQKSRRHKKNRPPAPPPPPPPRVSAIAPTTPHMPFLQTSARSHHQHHESIYEQPPLSASIIRYQVRAGVRNNSRECNGSVHHQTSDKTYEVYHIIEHQEKGIPTSSYSYLPHHASHSSVSSSKDLSLGSCDNNLTTPESLGSQDDEQDSLSSPFQRLQNSESDDNSNSDRLQCMTSVLSDESFGLIVRPKTALNNNNTIKKRPAYCTGGGNTNKDVDLLSLKKRSTALQHSPPSEGSSVPSSPQNMLASSEADESSNSSVSSSNGFLPSMSSSLTPSTIVATVTSVSTNTQARPMMRTMASTVRTLTSTNYDHVKEPSTSIRYDGSKLAKASYGNDVKTVDSIENRLGELCDVTRDSRRAPSYQEARNLSQNIQLKPQTRSVGNTPPLPPRHTSTSNYMPLHAYVDYAPRLLQQQPHSHVYQSSELVLTPRQVQQLKQSLVNRYATIGRNYHINANLGHDQTKADIHHQQNRIAAHARMHRSNDNLALRINSNLTSSQNLRMTGKKISSSSGNPASFKKPSTAPTVSEASQKMLADDIICANLTTECCEVEGRVSDDEVGDHLQADSFPNVDKGKVRKRTLSTLLMRKPSKNPPFTIETAIKKIFSRDNNPFLETKDGKTGEEIARKEEKSIEISLPPPANLSGLQPREDNKKMLENSLVGKLLKSGSDRELHTLLQNFEISGNNNGGPCNHSSEDDDSKKNEEAKTQVSSFIFKFSFSLAEK